MNCIQCKDCRWWQVDESRYNTTLSPEWNPATDDYFTDEEKAAMFPHEVRYCKNPKVLFYQRPDADELAVFDGSEYCAYIATGPYFGCVNGETLAHP